MKILIIGYGNPGRLDDGLGPALADCIGAQRFAAQERSVFQALETDCVGAQKSFQGSEELVPVAARDFQALEEESVRPYAIGVESNYQLNVEDAAQIAEYDVVVFADASTDAEPPFTFEPVVAEAGRLSFSSHSVSAPQLMGMVKELFHAEPEAYMLAIRGVEFNEFGEKLSVEAQNNLNAAVEFLKEWLLKMTKNEIPNDGMNDELRNTQ